MKPGVVMMAAAAVVVAVGAPAAAYVLGAGSIAEELRLAAVKSDLVRLEKLTDRQALVADLATQFDGDRAAAGRYAEPRAIRGVLRKCDPSLRSDKAMRTAPEVRGASRVVSHIRVEMTCPATGGGEIRLTVEREGFATWRITKMDLPEGF